MHLNLLRLEISATGCVMKKNVDIEIFQYSVSQNSFHALTGTLLGIESYRLLRLITISTAFFGLRMCVSIFLQFL